MSTMVRLTASIREAIKEALLAKKYAKEDLEAETLTERYEEASAAANRIAYESVLSEAIRKKMASLPSGFFPRVAACTVRFYDPKDESNYSDERVHFGEAKPVPYICSIQSNIIASLPYDGPLSKALNEANSLLTDKNSYKKELFEKKMATMRRIDVILNSVTTVKRLQEIWPEVIEFMPEHVTGPQGGVPAQMISDLNKEFGL